MTLPVCSHCRYRLLFSKRCPQIYVPLSGKPLLWPRHTALKDRSSWQAWHVQHTCNLHAPLWWLQMPSNCHRICSRKQRDIAGRVTSQCSSVLQLQGALNVLQPEAEHIRCDAPDICTRRYARALIEHEQSVARSDTHAVQLPRTLVRYGSPCDAPGDNGVDSIVLRPGLLGSGEEEGGEGVRNMGSHSRRRRQRFLKWACESTAYGLGMGMHSTISLIEAMTRLQSPFGMGMKISERLGGRCKRIPH